VKTELSKRLSGLSNLFNEFSNQQSDQELKNKNLKLTGPWSPIQSNWQFVSKHLSIFQPCHCVDQTSLDVF